MSRRDELNDAARMLRAGLIRPEQFAEVCTEWMERPDSTLGDLIRDRGWLPVEETTQVQSPGPADPSAGEGGTPGGSTVVLASPPVLSTDATSEIGGSTRRAGFPGGAGRYRRLLQAGRGGIGVVWRAFDEHLGREVALKEPRPDRPLGPVGEVRFLEEARVTGQLQHPGIVPLFDLVDDPASGGPYYTMRLVEGRTLQRAAREYRDRLELGRAGPTELVDLLGAFVSACQAVSYAHARGVLHRDLKGANVILGDFGEVHVLDWGLAKRSDQPEGESDLGPLNFEGSPDRDATQADQAVGTPGYMAPEQTGKLPSGTPIDRRTDVYGLGAVLYETLTGRAPFLADDRAEVIRLVCEEPPAPPRRACPTAPAALEAVCLKALSKRPEDRYESAAEVAAEVRRWLADEPVRAYPEPRAVRAARWARRHRSIVAGAAVALVAVALTAVAGAAIVAAKNRALALARDEARDAARLALQERDRAEENRAEADRQREQAEANLASARALAMDMLDLAAVAVARTPGAEAIRKRLVDRVLETFLAIHARRPDDPALRHDLAEVYAELAKVRQLLNELGPSTEAASASIRLIEGLAAERPNAPYYPNRLAELLRDQSQALDRLGRLGEAREALARAVEIARGRLQAGPDDEGRRTLGSSLLDLADVETRTGRFDDAVARCDESLDLLRALNEPPEPEPIDPMLLGLALNCRGRALAELGRAGEAEAAFGEGVTLCSGWLERTDGDVNHRYILGLGLDGRARLLATIPGRRAEAEAACLEALGHREALIASDGYAHYRADLALSRDLLGAIRLDDGRLDDAEEDFGAALDLLSRLLRESPDVPAYLGHAGRLFAHLGRLSLARDDPSRAARRLEIAVAFLRLAVEACPEDHRDRRSLEAALTDLEAARRRLPP